MKKPKLYIAQILDNMSSLKCKNNFNNIGHKDILVITSNQECQNCTLS